MGIASAQPDESPLYRAIRLPIRKGGLALHALETPRLVLGDAVVFRGDHMHRGMANTSHRSRTILYVALARR